jgi:hypothetical protein
MGCDIHGFWEVQTPSGKWFAIREINDNRSYMWFGAVAGVRSQDISPIVAVRGSPADASIAWVDYCTDEIKSGFLHHPTWLTPSEISAANTAYWEATKDWQDTTVSRQPNDHESIPRLTDEVRELITGYNYVSGHGNTQIIKWAGTVEELIGKDAIYEQSIRFVCAFDN